MIIKNEVLSKKEIVTPAEVCEKTRMAGSQAFLAAIETVWKTSFSETLLRDLWQEELKRNDSLFPSGWYTSPPPEGPPYGIGILIGRDTQADRLNYDSLRPPENHPQTNIVFDQETGITYVYASPVDRTTGIIGDWGMTLYAGNNSELSSFLQKVRLLNPQIIEKIKPGVKVSDVYQQALQVFDTQGLTNNVTSITDIAEINIGHSVPGTLKPFSDEELTVINSGNWPAACRVISTKRVFFNGNEEHVFKTGDCFTLEPRLTDVKKPHLPMVSFHTIFVVTETGVELLENFEDVFRATEMNYMLESN